MGVFDRAYLSVQIPHLFQIFLTTPKKSWTQVTKKSDPFFFFAIYGSWPDLRPPHRSPVGDSKLGGLYSTSARKVVVFWILAQRICKKTASMSMIGRLEGVDLFLTKKVPVFCRFWPFFTLSFYWFCHKTQCKKGPKTPKKQVLFHRWRFFEYSMSKDSKKHDFWGWRRVETT